LADQDGSNRQWTAAIILRSRGPKLSNDIIQKGLAFGRDWSGSVVNSGRQGCSEILPRELNGRGGASVVRRDAAIDQTACRERACIHGKIASCVRAGDQIVAQRWRERQMDLSEGIRLKVEKHGEKDIILDVMKSLQGDGVMITEDVYEAIVTTLRYTQGIVDN
jgi:hypothetical protein